MLQSILSINREKRKGPKETIGVLENICLFQSIKSTEEVFSIIIEKLRFLKRLKPKIIFGTNNQNNGRKNKFRSFEKLHDISMRNGNIEKGATKYIS